MGKSRARVINGIRNTICIVMSTITVVTIITLKMSAEPPTTIVSESEFTSRLRGPLAGTDSQVVKILRDSFLNPPSTLPYNLSGYFNYQEGSSGSSWMFIHQFVEKLFTGQREGFFIEAGALDGEYLSNTLWLEQQLGWTGLLVEPDLHNYQVLTLKHRKAWTSNTCFSSQPFPKEIILVSLRRKSLNQLHPWDFRGSSYELTYNLGTTITGNAQESYSLVQCFPLVTYLLALNVTKVDFLSLDIQGSEKQVLETFPWNTVRVRLMVVENVTKKTDHDFIAIMKKRGYNLVALAGDHDYVFIGESEFKYYHFQFIHPKEAVKQ
ncbi:protein Star-like [Cherax quadricarinatus]|uniref:protein Star-like n=1 Tax=Cherax quadricarinatus TaxID=27406 RepID=UPI002379EABD|nr:protein Star-like [Cherax quadricarinatus]